MTSAAITRGLVHPGPPALGRRQAARAALRPVAGRLRAGRAIMAEVAALFAREGCRGGMLELGGLTCEPFAYVLPALATDGRHAAFYSATHAPSGRVRIEAATATVGLRDGAPFLHCHGRWTGAFGTAMGHLLPFETILAEDAEARGLGTAEAWFEAEHDSETNFTLFSARGGSASRGPADGLLARLRPGEDVCAAIAALCAEHGIVTARVHGIGSIFEPSFASGARVPCPATEVRIDDGRVRAGRAEILASLVDVAGQVHSGKLARGANPVGVTFELLIEPAP